MFLLRKRTLLLYKIKTYEPLQVRKLYSNGATDQNRTGILALARPHTNRCTTAAYLHYILFFFVCKAIFKVLLICDKIISEG